MPKSRLAYILLALFLGTFGVHNFYAGYTGRGIAQLLLSLISFGFLSPIVFIWAIIEICTVTKDKDGVNFVN
jgi:TM2 domain-containing membrane protein YozV